MKRSGVRTKNKTARGALVFGIALNVAAFFICTLVSSAIILSTDNPTGNVGMGSMISFFICAAICGFAVSKYKGEGGALPAIASALLFTLVLLAIGLISTKGAIPLATVLNYAAYVIISALCAFFAARKTPRRHRR